MLLEIMLAFSVIAMSLAGLGIGLLFGRQPPRGSCATAMTTNDETCPVCGRNTTIGKDKP